MMVNAAPPPNFAGAERSDAEPLAASVNFDRARRRQRLRRLRRDTAPGDLAAIDWCSVVQQLQSRARVQTVGAD